MKKMLLLMAVCTGVIQAQELEKHRWENRLLVIYTTEFNTAEVQEQLEILKLAKADLKDRRVKVYTLTEDKFRADFSVIDQPAKRKRNIAKPFEVVLIGLDGGEKYRSEEVQPVQTFNALIDQMPMRRNELKKNKY